MKLVFVPNVVTDVLAVLRRPDLKPKRKKILCLVNDGYLESFQIMPTLFNIFQDIFKKLSMTIIPQSLIFFIPVEKSAQKIFKYNLVSLTAQSGRILKYCSESRV